MKVENSESTISPNKPIQTITLPPGQKVMKVVRLPVDGTNQTKQVIVIPDQNGRQGVNLQGVNFQPLKPIQPTKTMVPNDLQDFLRDAIIRPIANIVPQVRIVLLNNSLSFKIAKKFNLELQFNVFK